MGFSKIPFSTGSSRPKDRTQVSCIAGRFLTVWTTRGAPLFLYVVPKGRFPEGLSPRPRLVTLQIPSRQSSQQHDFTTNSQGDDSQVSVSSTGFAPVFYDLNMYLFWLGVKALLEDWRNKPRTGTLPTLNSSQAIWEEGTVNHVRHWRKVWSQTPWALEVPEFFNYHWEWHVH